MERQALDGQQQCPRCGSERKAGALFCTQCGYTFDAADSVLSLASPPLLAGQTTKVAAGCGVAGLFACPAACFALLLFATLPNPVALALVVTAAIVPAVFYGLLFLLLDRFEAEPWYTLLGAFLWGALVATFFSLVLNSVTGEVVFMAWGEGASNTIVPLLVAPVVEETMKGMALVILLLAFRHELDSILDGIIYGGLIGLGFAMTENMVYFAAFLVEEGIGGLIVGFFFRAGIGGLAHAIFTAVTGAAIAWSRTRYGRGRLRFVVPVLGLVGAMALHGTWNAMAVLAAELGVGGALLVIIGFLLIIVSGLTAILAAAFVSWGRQLNIIREQLAAEVQLGTITMDEYTMLTHPHRRRRAYWRALSAGGPQAWLRMRRFAQLTSQLAFQKFHAEHGERQPLGFRRRSNNELRADIEGARRRLVAA